MFALMLRIGAVVHYGEDGDGFGAVIDDVVYAIVVDEHEPDSARPPWFA